MVSIIRTALESIARCTEDRKPAWVDGMAAALGGPAALALEDDDLDLPHLARFKAKELKPEWKQANVQMCRVFRNHNWEVTLLLEPDPDPKYRRYLRVSKLSTIKNINPAKRSLPLLDSHAKGLCFRIHQRYPGTDQRHWITLRPIDGQLLGWHDEAPFTEPTSVGGDNFDLSRDFTLEEVFTPSTSPIKSIEELKIGEPALSDRVKKVATLVPRVPPKQEENPEGTSGGPEGPGGGAQPPQSRNQAAAEGQAAMQQRMMGGAGGQGKENKSLTPNGLRLDRYILSNPQVRRVPIAFKIVMEQEYRNEVLAAVANSRLRIKTEQVYLAHREDYRSKDKSAVEGILTGQQSGVSRPGAGLGPERMTPSTGGSRPPGSLGSRPPEGFGSRPPEGFGSRPPGGSGTPPPGGGSRPPGSGSRPPEGFGSMPPGGMGSPVIYNQQAPPGTTAGGTEKKNDKPDDLNNDLIEFNFHGIATLFQRYKEEGKDGQPSGPQSQPGPSGQPSPPK
jgi:hypothetical protein